MTFFSINNEKCLSSKSVC